jgi:hypothetical protein
MTFTDTETTQTQGELAHREGFAHALLTYSCTALGVLALLTVYNDSLSLAGSLWLSGGCFVAFAAGIAFALAARELGTTGQARTVATVAAVVNTLLLLVAGVTLVALWALSQMEFSF